MNFSNEGYDGNKFYDFHVRKDSSSGPGWFIYGRNSNKYGTLPDGKGAYVMLCGYQRRGRHRSYNTEVRIGWRTKKDAENALADYLDSHPNIARKNAEYIAASSKSGKSNEIKHHSVDDFSVAVTRNRENEGHPFASEAAAEAFLTKMNDKAKQKFADHLGIPVEVLKSEAEEKIGSQDRKPKM